MPQICRMTVSFRWIKSATPILSGPDTRSLQQSCNPSCGTQGTDIDDLFVLSVDISLANHAPFRYKASTLQMSEQAFWCWMVPYHSTSGTEIKSYFRHPVMILAIQLANLRPYQCIIVCLSKKGFVYLLSITWGPVLNIVFLTTRNTVSFSPQDNPNISSAISTMSDPKQAESSTPKESQQKIEKRNSEYETTQNPYFTNTTQAPDTKRKLPHWLDHFNLKDGKKLFKCSIAVWIMTILIFISPTLNVLGQAAFVGW